MPVLVRLALLGFGLAAESCGLAASARLNVLFVAVDDLRTTLGCYGDPVAQTPHLDRLAARGTLFRRAYCQQAVCNPSRQSLLSGRRPDTLRIWANDPGSHFRQTAPDVVPLPEHFKRHGYFAQSIGKIYHGFQGMSDRAAWSVPEAFAYVPKRDDYRLAENRDADAPEKKAAPCEFVDAPEDAYPDGQVAAAAVTALERLASERGAPPFFLAVGIRKPHLPFTAPRKYRDLYDPARIPPLRHAEPPAGGPAIALHASVETRGYRDVPKQGAFPAALTAEMRLGYYAATSFADAQIGRVLAALERTGLARNTIVVVWGDHGFHLGEFGLWAKETNYEVATRVPLIVATPDDRPRGVRTDALVELLDLYPTLVELCGLPPREKLEGRSFATNLGDVARAGKPAAFSQFTRPGAMGYAIRTADYRYVEWRRRDTGAVMARELYAYAGDALFETKNLADEAAHREHREKLAALLPRATPPERADAKRPKKKT
jgi:iduronate 2-sulfatase